MATDVASAKQQEAGLVEDKTTLPQIDPHAEAKLVRKLDFFIVSQILDITTIDKLYPQSAKAVSSQFTYKN
jgi:hypothetical protein